jgi:hypothetical protein
LARFLGLANVVDGTPFGHAGTVLVRPDRLRLAVDGAGLVGTVLTVGFRGDRSVVRLATSVGELVVWTGVDADLVVGSEMVVTDLDEAVVPLDVD